MAGYQHSIIDAKWQAFWDREQTFKTPSDRRRPKYYVLDMFPYPSGDGLHVGHPKGYTATDIVARAKRMMGFNVLRVMGWDSFGLPAERRAERTGEHPSVITARNIATFKGQLQKLGLSYDWTRELATSDPGFYKWTQWIFEVLFERGLAYRAEVPVNFCPALVTVLANEEVHDGKYVETGDPVEKRVMNRGYYPIRVSDEEYLAMQEDADLVDKRFKEVMVEGTARWIDMAEDKMAGSGIRVVACPANDDMFEIDDILTHANLVETGDEEHPIELDGMTMVSMGWTNPTPWHTFREAPEDQLAKRIERALEHAGEPDRTILNFHAPPYGSKLDNAPALNDDLTYKSGGQALRPVGSTSVHDAIKSFQPILSLHGHIHESKGATRIGGTLALNPGSSYEEGILQAAIVRRHGPGSVLASAVGKSMPDATPESFLRKADEEFAEFLEEPSLGRK
jgi:leucyl-tRNA synthetase